MAASTVDRRDSLAGKDNSRKKKWKLEWMVLCLRKAFNCNLPEEIPSPFYLSRMVTQLYNSELNTSALRSDACGERPGDDFQQRK